MCVHQLHSSSTEFTDSYYDGLYPGHIHTTPTQKALLAVGSGVAALQNPYRHGETHTHQHGAWVSSPVTVFADLCFLFHLPFFFSFKKCHLIVHLIAKLLWHIPYNQQCPVLTLADDICCMSTSPLSMHFLPVFSHQKKAKCQKQYLKRPTKKKKKLSHEQKSTALQPSYRLSTIKSNMEIALLTVQWKAPHFLYFGNLRRICHTLQPSWK